MKTHTVSNTRDLHTQAHGRPQLRRSKVNRAAAKYGPQLAHRLDANLRDYVSAEAASLLPAPHMRLRPAGARLQSGRDARGWLAAWNNADQHRIKIAVEQAAVPWERWIIAHPECPSSFGQTLANRSSRNLQPDDYHPTGMTVERALQIALEVLEKRGGRW
jgi:hypothetical protein